MCVCARACAYVIISSVWAFFWSAGVLIESDGLSVEAQCRSHYSCNCQVRRFHTGTVLFNWKWTFPFFKRQPLGRDVSHPLSFHSVFVKLQDCLLPAVNSSLMKPKTCFYGLFVYVCPCLLSVYLSALLCPSVRLFFFPFYTQKRQEDLLLRYSTWNSIWAFRVLFAHLHMKSF